MNPRSGSSLFARVGLAPAALFLACLAGPPVQADLATPSCGRLEGWAEGYDADDRWEVNAYLRLPGIARDKYLEPLFGQSLLTWSRDDFQAFNAQVAHCRDGARQQRRTPALRALNSARRAVFRAAGDVERIRTAVETAERAVGELAAMPDSAVKKKALHQAERSLRGRFDRRELGDLPQAASASIKAIDQARRWLPEERVDGYATRLGDQYRAQAAPAAAAPDSGGGSRPAGAAGPRPELDPPSLAAGSELRSTRLEGVALGMALEMAVSLLQEQGYEEQRRWVRLRELGPARQYPVENVTLSIDKVAPFPGGSMTDAERRAYLTRNAINSLKSKTFNISAFEGRVAQMSVSGSSFVDVDTLQAETLRALGEPREQRGRAGHYWSLEYREDQAAATEADLQLTTSYRKSSYTDYLKQERKSFSSVGLSIMACEVFPKCL